MAETEGKAGTPESPVVPDQPYDKTVRKASIGEDTHVMYEKEDGSERVVAIRDSFYHRRLARKDSGYRLVKGKALGEYLDKVAADHTASGSQVEDY